VVNDPTGSVTSAELRLCGSRVKLRQSGHRFTATQFSCAGDGYVAVRLADGRETSRRIGYVTSGAEQHLEFDIADARCTVKASIRFRVPVHGVGHENDGIDGLRWRRVRLQRQALDIPHISRHTP
jgi:hypothetical protein